MITRSIGFVVGLCAGVALGACGSPLEVGHFGVDGAWRGTVYLHSGSDSVPYLFRVELAQDGKSVSGNGAVVAPADSVRTEVSGHWEYPDVTLTFSSEGYQDIGFASQFTPRTNPDTLRGPLTGSGFDGSTLTLVRQAP